MTESNKKLTTRKWSNICNERLKNFRRKDSCGLLLTLWTGGGFDGKTKETSKSSRSSSINILSKIDDGTEIVNNFSCVEAAISFLRLT
jgi:hypothetical protein